MLRSTEERREPLQPGKEGLALESRGHTVGQGGAEVLRTTEERREPLQPGKEGIALESLGHTAGQGHCEVPMPHDVAEAEQRFEPRSLPQAHLDATHALHDVHGGAAAAHLLEVLKVGVCALLQRDVGADTELDAARGDGVVVREPEGRGDEPRLHAGVLCLGAHLDVGRVAHAVLDALDTAAQPQEPRDAGCRQLGLRLVDVLLDAPAVPVALVVLDNERAAVGGGVRYAGVREQQPVAARQGREHALDGQRAVHSEVEHRGDALQLGGRVQLALRELHSGQRALGHVYRWYESMDPYITLCRKVGRWSGPVYFRSASWRPNLRGKKVLPGTHHVRSRGSRTATRAGTRQQPLATTRIDPLKPMDERYAHQGDAAAARGALAMCRFEPGDAVLVSTHALVAARRRGPAAALEPEPEPIPQHEQVPHYDPWIDATVEGATGTRVTVRTASRAFHGALTVAAQYVAHHPLRALEGAPQAAEVLGGRVRCAPVPLELQAVLEDLAAMGQRAAAQRREDMALADTAADGPLVTADDATLLDHHVAPVLSETGGAAAARGLLIDRMAAHVLDSWRCARPPRGVAEAEEADTVREAAVHIHRDARVWDPTGERAAAATRLVAAARGESPWDIGGLVE